MQNRRNAKTIESAFQQEMEASFNAYLKKAGDTVRHNAAFLPDPLWEQMGRALREMIRCGKFDDGMSPRAKVVREAYFPMCIKPTVYLVFGQAGVCTEAQELRTYRFAMLVQWAETLEILYVFPILPDGRTEHSFLWNAAGTDPEAFEAILPTVKLFLQGGDTETSAYIDPLTDIPNNQGFCCDAERLLRRFKEENYAVLELDVDRFKYINRTYGFSVGDEVLKNIAKNLFDFCGPRETCGRIHNDSFAMLLRYADEAALSRRLDGLLDQLVDGKLQEKLRFHTGFSAGVYRVPKTEREDVDLLLEKALLAKKTIKNRHHSNSLAFFDDNMWQEMIREAHMERRMFDALAQQEFLVYLQPQYSIAERTVIGAEALVRWQEPEYGFLLPDLFVPLFERNGFIVNMDMFVLEQVLKQLAAWKQAGVALLPISVNQSRRHLIDETYPEKLRRLVTRYGIPPEMLVFELTESIFLEDQETILRAAKKLRSYGFQLSVDDFGSGYSSLRLLQDLETDVLKIDKSLIESVVFSQRNRVILQKVVDMAQELGMLVVCEGVESAEQAALLQSIHCRLAQGYYFAHPMPMAQFAAQWRRSRNKKDRTQ